MGVGGIWDISVPSHQFCCEPLQYCDLYNILMYILSIQMTKMYFTVILALGLYPQFLALSSQSPKGGSRLPVGVDPVVRELELSVPP